MILSSFSIKGGAGKSTALINLGVCFARMGVPLLMVDADPHSKSLRRWCSRRDKLSASKIDWLYGEPGKQLRLELEKLRDQYHYILIDNHGADIDATRQLLLCSDAIIAPFKPSQAEVDTVGDFLRMMNDLKSIRPQVKLVSFLTEASTLTARDKKEARAFLDSKGIHLLESVLHNRQVFKDCLSTGLGVVEMTNPKGANEFNELFFEVLRTLLSSNIGQTDFNEVQ